MTSIKTVRTMCPMNCHPTLCGMQVTVENNKLKSISGDKGNPDSRGFLCVRGQAAKEIIGNPERLLQPMIRDSRQDDWREVSLEQALNTIITKLQQIDAEKFGIWLGHGDAATNYGTRLGGLLSQRFAHLYGCQWWHPAMVCWGLGGFGFGLTGLLDVNTKEDMSAHSDLVILWGANIASQPNTSPHIQTAKKRGARVITIDVRYSEACALSDEYYLIKPATDTALALSMMHVIIQEQLQDDDFIGKHTLGFEPLSEHIKPYTPQWAANITGISATAIVKLAKQYATTKRSMILVGGSSMFKHKNGWESSRAISCLPALTGKVGLKGAGLGPRHGAKATGQALNNLLADTENKCKQIIPNQMSAMTEAICDGKVSALLLSGTDMLSSFADTARLEQGLADTELIICHDLFMNDTIRRCADVVIPATAWLEQVGCKMTNTHLYFMEQALPAPEQVMTLSQLLSRMATSFQIDNFFPWENDEQMIDEVVQHPSTNMATVNKLRQHGGIMPLDISHQAYTNYKFPTPSGKIEFYSEIATQSGFSALPDFTQVKTENHFPLSFRQGRTMKNFHAFYDHGRALPSLKKFNQMPELWLSTEDAESRQIHAGSIIRINNTRGEMLARAHVTDKITTGTVWMRDGWSDLNTLTSGESCLPDKVVDIFNFSSGQAAYEANVEVVLVE